MSDLHNQLERALLGSIFRWPAILDEVTQIVTAQDFRKDAHQKIYSAALAVSTRGPVDILTVSAEINVRGWADDAPLALLWELHEGEPTGAHGAYYARQLKSDTLSRSLGWIGHKLSEEVAKPFRPPTETLDYFTGQLMELSVDRLERRAISAAEAANSSLDRLDERQRGNQRIGLPTGLHDLDEIIGGVRDGELTLVAARPSVGKSAFGIGLAVRFTEASVPTLFVSLEMSTADVMDYRLFPAMSGIDSHRLRRGRLEPQEQELICMAANKIRSLPLYIDDQPNQTPMQISARCRQEYRSRGVRAVILDYMQLVNSDDRRANTYERVGEASRRMKLLAKELNIPVVAMAQLNRQADDREPRLSDLRDSGNLEQDADNVILLHREGDQEDRPVQEIFCNVAKHRNGPTGVLTLGFRKATARFESYTVASPYD